MGSVNEQMMNDQEQNREDEVAEYLSLTSVEYGSTEHDYDERNGEDVIVFTSISDEIKAKVKDYNYDDNTVPIDWNQIGPFRDVDE